MLSIEHKFNYVRLGGICSYDTNVVIALPDLYPFFDISETDYIYAKDTLVLGFDSNTFQTIDINIDSTIDALNATQLIFTYCTEQCNCTTLRLSWTTVDNYGPEYSYYLDIDLQGSPRTFTTKHIDLLQYTGWRGEINKFRLDLFGSDTDLVYVRTMDFVSREYTCSHDTCVYKSKYKHPCTGSYYSETYKGVSVATTVSGISGNFVIGINNTTYEYKPVSDKYFLPDLLKELNIYLDSLPVGRTKFLYDEVVILTTVCSGTVLHNSTVMQALGFFSEADPLYTTEITPYLPSNYVDVVGNVAGTYDIQDQLFIPSITFTGNDPESLAISQHYVAFRNKTVLFKAAASSLTGVFTKYKVCVKTYTGSKIVVYRRYGDNYKYIQSIDLPDNNTGTIINDCYVYLHAGDVIGFYNVEVPLVYDEHLVYGYYVEKESFGEDIQADSINSLVYIDVPIYFELSVNLTNVYIPLAFKSYSESYIDSVFVDNTDYFNFEYEITNFFYTYDKYNKLWLDDGSIIDGTSEFYNVGQGIWKLYFTTDEQYVDELVTWLEFTTEILSKYTFIIKNAGLTITATDSESVDTNIKIFDFYTLSGGDLVYEKSLKPYLKSVLGHTSKTEGGFYVCSLDLGSYRSNGFGFRLVDDIQNKIISDDEYQIPARLIDYLIISITSELPPIPCYTVITDLGYNYATSSRIDISDFTTTFNCHLLSYGFESITFNMFKVVSSRVPDDIYKVNENDSSLILYNTHIQPLTCIIDSSTKLLYTDVVYDNDGSDDLLLSYTHGDIRFRSDGYKLNDYKIYLQESMLTTSNVFGSAEYDFTSSTYDWFRPYDFDLGNYDGVFEYSEYGLTITPVADSAVRWFNFIHSYIYEHDFYIECSLRYVGNTSDIANIGITFFNQEDEYIRYAASFSRSPSLLLEKKFKDGDLDVITRYFRSIGTITLAVHIVSRVMTFYITSGGVQYKVFSADMLDGMFYVTLSTFFQGSAFEDNVIAYITNVAIEYKTQYRGKRIWYSADDNFPLVYAGNVFDGKPILANIGVELKLPTNNTVKKVEYVFDNLKTRYIKLVASTSTVFKITEISVYNDDEKLSGTGLMSYDYNPEFGSLDIEAPYITDGSITSEDFSYSLNCCDDYNISSAGLDLGDMCVVNKVVCYYIYEGSSLNLALMHSYDNHSYFAVFSNTKLLEDSILTKVHYLCNRLGSYCDINTRSVNPQVIIDPDFTTECPPDNSLWSISPSYVCDDGIKYDENSNYYIVSRFYLDGDCDVRVHYRDLIRSDINNYYIELRLAFVNGTYMSVRGVAVGYVGVVKNGSWDTKTAINAYTDNRGGLRLVRTGTTIKFYFRQSNTTWVKVDEYECGGSCAYPAGVICYVHKCGGVVEYMYAEAFTVAYLEDLVLSNSYFTNARFVGGAKTSGSSSSYLVANTSELILKPERTFIYLFNVYNTISDFGSISRIDDSYFLYTVSSSPSLYFGDVFWMNYDYTYTLTVSDTTNTLLALSLGESNIDSSLFQDVSDSRIIFAANSENVSWFVYEVFDDDTLDNLALEGGRSYRVSNYKYYMRLYDVLYYTDTLHGFRDLYVSIVVKFNSFINTFSLITLTPDRPYNYGCGTTYYDKLSLCVNSIGQVYLYGFNKSEHLYTFSIGVKTYVSVRFIGDYIYICIKTHDETYMWSDSFSTTSIQDDIHLWSGYYTGSAYSTNHTDSCYFYNFYCGKIHGVLDVLKDAYVLDVSPSDTFGGSDGRVPDSRRWDVYGDPRTQSGCIRLRSAYSDKITSKYYLIDTFTIIIRVKDLVYNHSSYSGFRITLDFYMKEVLARYLYQDKLFVGFVSDSGIELNLRGNTVFVSESSLSSLKLKIVNDGTTLSYYYTTAVDYTLINTIEYKTEAVSISLEAIGDGTDVKVDYILITDFDQMTIYSPQTCLSTHPYTYDFRNTWIVPTTFMEHDLTNVLHDTTLFSIDTIFNIVNDFPFIFILWGDISEDGKSYYNIVSDKARLLEILTNGGFCYLAEGVYDLSNDNVSFHHDITIIGVGNVYNTVIRFNTNSSYGVSIYGGNQTFINVAIHQKERIFECRSATTLVLYNCYCHSSNSPAYYGIRTYVAGVKVYVINTRFTRFNYLYAYYGSYNYVPYIFVYNSCSDDGYRTFDYAETSVRVWSDSNISGMGCRNICKFPVISVVCNNGDVNFCTGDVRLTFDPISVYSGYVNTGVNVSGLYTYTSFNGYNLCPFSISTNCIISKFGNFDTYTIFKTALSISEIESRLNDFETKCLPMLLYVNGHVVNYNLYRYKYINTSTTLYGRSLYANFDEIGVFEETYSVERLDNIYSIFNSFAKFDDFSITEFDCYYRFYIDFEDTVSIDKILYDDYHTFNTMLFLNGGEDIPNSDLPVSTPTECRWYALESKISSANSDCTCGTVRFYANQYLNTYSKYIGVRNYLDVVSDAVIDVSVDIWGDIKCVRNDYTYCYVISRVPGVFAFYFSSETNISRITIDSGIDTGSSFCGYITELQYTVGDYTNTITSIINSTIDIVLPTVMSSESVILTISTCKPIDEYNYQGVYFSGNYVVINNVVILGDACKLSFNDTLTYYLELHKLIANGHVIAPNECWEEMSVSEYPLDDILFRCVDSYSDEFNGNDGTKPNSVKWICNGLNNDGVDIVILDNKLHFSFDATRTTNTTSVDYSSLFIGNLTTYIYFSNMPFINNSYLRLVIDTGEVQAKVMVGIYNNHYSYCGYANFKDDSHDFTVYQGLGSSGSLKLKRSGSTVYLYNDAEATSPFKTYSWYSDDVKIKIECEAPSNYKFSVDVDRFVLSSFDTMVPAIPLCSDLANVPTYVQNEYTGPIRTVIFRSEAIKDCTVKYPDVDVIIQLGFILNDLDFWYVSLGDVNLTDSLYYARLPNTNSVVIGIFKETLFEVSTHAVVRDEFDSIGILDTIVLLLESEVSLDNVAFRIGDFNAYYEWVFDLHTGENEVLLTQEDASLKPIRYGKVDYSLLFTDLDIQNIRFGCNVPTGVNGNIAIRDIYVESKVDNALLSSWRDALELPVNSTIQALKVKLLFTPYWDITGAVFKKYRVYKNILAVFGEDVNISLANNQYGKFEVNITVPEYQYKRKYTVGSYTNLGYKSQLEVVLVVCIVDSRCLVKVVVGGDTIFNKFIPVEAIFNELNIFKVVVGAGKVYTTHADVGVSLCGLFEHLTVYVSNNTEFKVADSDDIYIDVGSGYEPLSDVVPYSLGLVQPGDNVQVPIKVITKNTDLSLRIKWVYLL